MQIVLGVRLFLIYLQRTERFIDSRSGFLKFSCFILQMISISFVRFKGIRVKRLVTVIVSGIDSDIWFFLVFLFKGESQEIRAGGRFFVEIQRVTGIGFRLSGIFCFLIRFWGWVGERNRAGVLVFICSYLINILVVELSS